jgi:hypothetical protein
MDMEWTIEKRIAASRNLNIKKFGEDDGSEAEHRMWAQRAGDIAEAITLQCEVTALREALEEMLYLVQHTDVRHGVPCDKARALLTNIQK